jgi:hypothetical protein
MTALTSILGPSFTLLTDYLQLGSVIMWHREFNTPRFTGHLPLTAAVRIQNQGRLSPPCGAIAP